MSTTSIRKSPVLFGGLFFLLLLSDIAADNRCFLFVPDSENQRLVQLRVLDRDGTLSIESENSLNLPFRPTSIAANKDRNQFILTSGNDPSPQAATVQLLREGNVELRGLSRLKFPGGYTSVDRTGRYFLTAHYGSGTIAS